MKESVNQNFKTVIEDLLDNYEKYTEEEKVQIKRIFQKVSELNAILDQYDIENEFAWQDYFDSVSRYFSAN